MAKIQKKGKGTPPPEEKAAATGNLDKGSTEKLVAMNFRVTPDFRREFRTYASEMDIPMVELLRLAFEYYKGSN